MLISNNKLYTLVFGMDGNINVYDFRKNIVFSTNIQNGNRLIANNAGFVSIYDNNNNVVWSPPNLSFNNSPGITGGAYLVLEDDGTITIYRLISVQRNITSVINGKTNLNDMSRTYPVTVWESQNNIRYNIADLNNQCPVCNQQSSTPYETQKSCNCDVPLTSISNYVNSFITNKTTGQTMYMSNPVTQTSMQQSGVSTQTATATVTTTPIQQNQIAAYIQINGTNYNQNQFKNISINYVSSLDRFINPIQYPKLKSVTAQGSSVPQQFNILNSNNQIINPQNKVQLYLTTLTYQIPNLYSTSAIGKITSTNGFNVTNNIISNPLSSNMIPVSAQVFTTKPINGTIQIYYGNINGSGVGLPDQITPPFLPTNYIFH